MFSNLAIKKEYPATHKIVFGDLVLEIMFFFEILFWRSDILDVHLLPPQRVVLDQRPGTRSLTTCCMFYNLVARRSVRPPNLARSANRRSSGCGFLFW